MQSMMQLKNVQREKYKNDPDIENLVNAEVATFRPSIVINEEYEEPYIEEEFSEMRI